jgi:V8-like Glu-specific endopeptidase
MLAHRALLTLLFAAASWGACAADAPDNRSALSYEDNVTINTACFATRSQGDGAYERCAHAQADAVAAHPAPDRSGIKGSLAQQVERDCRYLRLQGIAAYNDCLTKGVNKIVAEAKPPAEGETGDDDVKLTATKLFAGPDEEKATPVAATLPALPKPREILPPRSTRVALQALSPADVYKKVEHAIFIVFAAPSLADARARNLVQGSAVAISDHLLLTNCHVVKGRPEIRIVQDKVITPAKLVAGDMAADRCIIKTDARLEPVSGVRAFEDLAVGERVFAIGTPRGLERTLSEGLVSALRKLSGRHVVQTSASITHGSSGGGLFDERGNLIGITTAGIDGTQLEFAIAASDYWE